MHQADVLGSSMDSALFVCQANGRSESATMQKISLDVAVVAVVNVDLHGWEHADRSRGPAK